jgi:hypothetical protein
MGLLDCRWVRQAGVSQLLGGGDDTWSLGRISQEGIWNHWLVTQLLRGKHRWALPIGHRK